MKGMLIGGVDGDIMADKRRRTRVAARYEVQVRGEESSFSVLTLDISLNGFSSEPDERLEQGREYSVSIEFSPEAVSRARARVVRAWPDRAAFEFVEIFDEGFSHLHRALSLMAGDADVIDDDLAFPGFDSQAE